MAVARLVILVIGGVIGALLYPPLAGRANVLGIFKGEITPLHGAQQKLIANTLQCEDLHHHRPSNLLFAACQTGDPHKRHQWFPPLGHFNLSGVGQGTIVVVNPETFESTPLALKGFRGPFVTHGIDLFSNPADPTHVTIFAINHLPHPDAASPTQVEKARSQVEVFRHEIGSKTAHHVRSIRHPLIRTPNDLYATSATSFYTTNDHFYRDGPLRFFEDLAPATLALWTDTVHVSFSDMETSDPAAGVTATVALANEHNNNGLGHGSSADPSLVLICDASGGGLALARRNLTPRPREPDDVKLTVFSRIQADSVLDNPSFYEDPYAISSNNASGIVVAGVSRAIALGAAAASPGIPIPLMVWHITPGQEEGTWHNKLIYEDDGTTISSASAAVLVPVDPVVTEGKKQAWLFVTGFLSNAMVASLIDL